MPDHPTRLNMLTDDKDKFQAIQDDIATIWNRLRSVLSTPVGQSAGQTVYTPPTSTGEATTPGGGTPGPSLPTFEEHSVPFADADGDLVEDNPNLNYKTPTETLHAPNFESQDDGFIGSETDKQNLQLAANGDVRAGADFYLKSNQKFYVDG